jgi:hypothetical protein
MHEYTARIIHTDRMAELRREADAYRLARIVPAGRRRRTLRFVLELFRAQLGRAVIPRRTASAAASTRPPTPSLPRMLDT